MKSILDFIFFKCCPEIIGFYMKMHYIIYPISYSFIVYNN